MRFVLLLIGLALAPIAVASDVDTAVHALEARYHGAKTLRAVFFESYSDGRGGKSAESGVVYFSRPGRMRWDYQSPEKKLFLVDGTNVWFYVPADRTASRAKLKESSDWRTPLALLVGKADLTKICRDIQILTAPAQLALPAAQPEPAGSTTLRCVPRDPGDRDEQIVLEMNRDQYLVRVVIRSAENVTTEFRFGNWEQNVPLAESTFHFEPPSGVSIIDEESLLGQMR